MLKFPTASVSPALETHFETQLAFYTNLSGKFFDAVQKLSRLNIQVAKTMLEESIEGTQQAATLKTPTDLIGHLANRSKPSFAKVYAYQQHIQRIIAETQNGVSESVQTYGPESARATQALVSEAVQTVAEEAGKVAERQKEIAGTLTASIVDRLESATKPNPTTEA